MKTLLLFFVIGMHPFWQETQRIKKLLVLEGVLTTDGQTAWHFGGGDSQGRLVRKIFTVKDGKVSDCNIEYPGRGFGRNIFFVRDSFMYLGGGMDSCIARYTEREMWRYDMRNGEWKQLAELPFYYMGKPTVLQNDSGIYTLVPVLHADFRNTTCRVFRYETTADTWEELSGAPGSVSVGATAFGIGNDIYVFCEDKAMPVNWTNTFYRFRAADNSWQEMATFPGTPRTMSMAMSDGRFGYIGGGSGRAWGGFTDIYRYNPIENSWLKMPDLPQAIHMGNAWRQDSTLYMGFGKAHNDNSTYIWKLAYK